MTTETTTAPTAPTFDSVYADVIEVLQGIVGEDYLEALEVSPQSRFEADLELESMEIVQLAEELVTRYPDVDFIAWFASMELDDLIALDLGAVTRFIAGASAGRVG